ncbi:hypothetical protein I41_20150 [Lacipirellula limnantheis]|uniref:Uncharacterized protein n=1 Tax=Lacipirellula limnantheis TaxID=2528024 RepID=A0A517TWU2_9BACT|nr:hypothetical protein I41_20150 [Lacipirellula limnantheis]
MQRDLEMVRGKGSGAFLPLAIVNSMENAQWQMVPDPVLRGH